MFFTMVQSNSPSRRQNQHETIHLLKSGMQDSLRGHADIIFYAWQGTDLDMSLSVRTNLCSVHSKIATIGCIFLLFENTHVGLPIVFLMERSQNSSQIPVTVTLMERLSKQGPYCAPVEILAASVGPGSFPECACM